MLAVPLAIPLALQAFLVCVILSIQCVFAGLGQKLPSDARGRTAAAISGDVPWGIRPESVSGLHN